MTADRALVHERLPVAVDVGPEPPVTAAEGASDDVHVVVDREVRDREDIPVGGPLGHGARGKAPEDVEGAAPLAGRGSRRDVQVDVVREGGHPTRAKRALSLVDVTERDRRAAHWREYGRRAPGVEGRVGRIEVCVDGGLAREDGAAAVTGAQVRAVRGQSAIRVAPLLLECAHPARIPVDVVAGRGPVRGRRREGRAAKSHPLRRMDLGPVVVVRGLAPVDVTAVQDPLPHDLDPVTAGRPDEARKELRSTSEGRPVDVAETLEPAGLPLDLETVDFRFLGVAAVVERPQIVAGRHEAQARVVEGDEDIEVVTVVVNGEVRVADERAVNAVGRRGRRHDRTGRNLRLVAEPGPGGRHSVGQVVLVREGPLASVSQHPG